MTNVAHQSQSKHLQRSLEWTIRKQTLQGHLIREWTFVGCSKFSSFVTEEGIGGAFRAPCYVGFIITEDILNKE